MDQAHYNRGKEGTMLRWIMDNGTLTNRTTEEADRLMPLLALEGFKTTRLSVIQAVGVARRSKGIPPPDRPGKTVTAKRKKALPTRRIQLNPRVEALEHFVNDALKGLQLLKGELRRLQSIERKYLAIRAQFDQ